ncbi:hypothetical protein CALCODRAFT_514315 [Calocera cornea HHB12733]|uniref:DUF6535 domain-containing protein n=1 Tax=Calocera cornea HHB12733 TaxID=1353952 RepID=A0A165JJJ4_9BASI|nr:hypothetical protein CALCODRAFT_514315 [Calocera cornea HHB12733]
MLCYLLCAFRSANATSLLGHVLAAPSLIDSTFSLALAPGREQPLPEDFWSGPVESTFSLVDVADNDATHSPTVVSIDLDVARIYPLPESAPASQESDAPDLPAEPPAAEGPFDRKFINDLPPVGRGPEAPVWPIYNEHADKADKEMLETYNGGMDNLLIFAALFSAVVTAFIVLSLPLLQADPAQPIVDALSIISSQLAAQGSANATRGSTLFDQGNAFSPTPSAVGINALWIMSLFVSLSTSVLAMLVKQWLRGYITNLPLPQKERATTRQARYDGVQVWRVAGIADSLPVLIHLAVALFLAGLVLPSFSSFAVA